MRNIVAAIINIVLSICLYQSSNADTTEAKRFIMQHYFKPLPEGSEALPWGEFKKLIDPYTELFSPADVKDFEERYNPLKTGRIGVTIEPCTEGMRITSVHPNGPAYWAGLRNGDVIVSVNDTSLVWSSAMKLPNIIRGASGSYFTMEFIRNGMCHMLVLNRDDIESRQIHVARVGRTLSVRIVSFISGIHQRFLDATEEMNPREIDTIVFDLRDNGGGLVSETVALLSEFIEVGDTLLGFQKRDGIEYETSGLFGRWRQPRTTIVLQNRWSASASEMFAGTMALRCSSIVIGEKSYGKGSMQRLYDGHAARDFTNHAIAGAKVSIARYLAGGSLWVDSVGVTPSIPADVPLGHQGHVPDTFDVVGWRMNIPSPTPVDIHRVNTICSGNVATVIWGVLAEPYAALDTFHSVQHLLPQQLPKRPTAQTRASSGYTKR